MFSEHSNRTQGLKAPLFEVNIKTIAKRKGKLFCSCLASIVIFPWWLKRQRICLQCGRPRLDPWVGKIPWRRVWQPPPVFFLGEVHGQRSLVGYSPRCHREPDTAEWLTLSLSSWIAPRQWREEGVQFESCWTPYEVTADSIVTVDFQKLINFSTISLKGKEAQI